MSIPTPGGNFLDRLRELSARSPEEAEQAARADRPGCQLALPGRGAACTSSCGSQDDGS